MGRTFATACCHVQSGSGAVQNVELSPLQTHSIQRLIGPFQIAVDAQPFETPVVGFEGPGCCELVVIRGGRSMIRPVLKRVLPSALFLLAMCAGIARADDPSASTSLPLTTSSSWDSYNGTVPQPLTIAQQRARYQADQRMMRMEWNKWIGYEPLRPSMPNAMMSNELNHHYMQPVRYRPVWGVWNNGSRIW